MNYSASKYVTATFILLFVGIAFLIGIAASNLQGSLTIALAVIGLISSIMILKRWQLGIYILFAWIVAEDLVRKFNGNAIGLYFLKDIILLLIYFSFFAREPYNGDRAIYTKHISTFSVPLIYFILTAVAYCIPSASTSAIAPLIGLRMWLIYVPLVVVGYRFATSTKNLQRFFAFYIFITLTICLLGITQSIIGLSFLNPDVSQGNSGLFLTRQTFSGQDIPRPTSTFNSAARFGKYTFMNSLLIFGIVTSQALQTSSRRIWIITATIAWSICLLSGFLSAQRSTILLIPVAFTYLLFSSWSDDPQAMNKKREYLLTFAIAIGIIAVITFLWLPDRATAIFTFLREPFARQTSEIGDRQLAYFGAMQFYWETHWFSGSGTGLASQGVTYFELPTLVENGYATLLYEFGLLGILLWLWLVLALIYATHKATKRLRDTPFFLLGKSVLIFQFSFLLVLFVVGVSSYQDYIVGANIWFFSGVLFGISDNIEKPCQPQISHPTRSLRHTLHHQYAQTK